ncbi:hypothetical protein OEA41_001692 [Lepraria neglecta]|uniref:Nephrocystin 3-like N-terminal domain-containing protein n=1 Tax=Lepraria neglecta TaxID=209136 RepID=A0AAD9ZB63_9LECA|nr:hypothetical protein OEA41_001692 [Lepraria neglecta]
MRIYAQSRASWPTLLVYQQSIVALLQFTATVVQYLSNVKDASDSRKRLLSEVSSASGLLYLLNDLAERDKWAKNWPATLRSLATSNGSLDQFRQALELLAKKLAPVAGLSKAGKVLAWPFEKGDVQFVLLTIERQKTLFILALQSDHIGLRNCTLSIRTKYSSTGQWLFETQEIKDRLTGASNVLWCSGIPRAGKILLASSTIDHLERIFPQMEIGISYIYCDYKDQSQTAVNLLGSLIGKLLWRQSIIPEELELSYKTHTSKHTHPSVTEYAAILRNMAMGFSRVFIVVDALDEVMEKDGTRDALMASLNDLSSNAQLLVTSRWIPSLEQEFCTASRLEIRANNGDIATYVQSQVDKRPRLRAHVRRDQNLRELIVENKGMFLLARLHVDSLANTAHPKAVKLALNQLPATLNKTYDETMQRVEQQDMKDIRLAHQVLSWIVCSFRPLTVEEL